MYQCLDLFLLYDDKLSEIFVQMQPQMMGAASGRVPLPVDLPEDGPIYVNAKQYHGILRRRQTRAKMEAQNKLVKTRKVSCIVAPCTWMNMINRLQF